MQTWEYVTVTVSDPNELAGRLNALGRQGWELVSVSALQFNYVLAFLKRPTTGAK